MVTPELIVKGQGLDHKFPLSPQGFLIGRSPDCQLVLENRKVSSKHALVYRDPFGRWMVQDLGSRNGVMVDGQTIKQQPLRPGETFRIGPYALAVKEEPQVEVKPDPLTETTVTLLTEGAEAQIATKQPQPLTANRFRQLEEFLEQLMKLSSASRLYGEACRLLASACGSTTAVLRLPPPETVLSPRACLLACYSAAGESDSVEVSSRLPLSRRVLETVRSARQAVSATSSRPDEGQLELTVFEVNNPRMVFCAPINESGEYLDVLYMDVPGRGAWVDIFDFVRLTASQMAIIRKALLISEAKAQREVLDHQLQMARDVQMRFIASALREAKGVDLATCYEPALWVGGDYYDVWQAKDGRLVLAVGDVVGKGLAAAMIMADLRASLRAVTAFCSDPAQVMEEVRRQLLDHLDESMFVTLVLAMFDPASGCLDYVNAGHLLPLLVNPDGPPRPLGEPLNPPIGHFDAALKSCRHVMAKNSGLVIVTDGVTEIRSNGDEEFGTRRLEEAVTGAPRTAQGVVKAVIAAAAAFRGSQPQHDDLTVLAMFRA